MELVTNGARLLHIHRRPTPPIAGLGPKQCAWLEATHKGISRNRVQRIADHKRAAAAYRIAELVDEARGKAEVV